MKIKKVAVIVSAISAAAVLLSGCLKSESSVSNTNGPVEMHALRSGEAGGAVPIDVREGETLRLEYNVTKGRFDLDIIAADFLSDPDAKVEDLARTADGEGTIQERDLSGTGEADYDVKPGTYVVKFTLHKVTGDASVSAVPKK